MTEPEPLVNQVAQRRGSQHSRAIAHAAGVAQWCERDGSPDPLPPRAIGGIGLRLEPKPTQEGYFRIHAAVPGTPAKRAGLAPGDEITAIDGRSVTGLTAEQVRNLTRGAAGTTIRLALSRSGQEREVTLTRETFGVTPELIRLTLEPNSATSFSELQEVKRNGRFQPMAEIHSRLTR